LAAAGASMPVAATRRDNICLVVAVGVDALDNVLAACARRTLMSGRYSGIVETFSACERESRS
jgi:hypothetical protein